MKKDWIIFLAVLALLFLLVLAVISTKRPEVADEFEVLEPLQQRQLQTLRESGEALKESPRPLEEKAPGEKIRAEMQKQMGLPVFPEEAEPPEAVTLPRGKRRLPEPQPAAEEEFETKESEEWGEPEEWEDPSLKELERIFSEELEELRSIPDDETQ